VPRSTRSDPLLYAGATAILLAAVLWVHARQGLSRPVPWPDEASFLWQAIAVQRDNTLFAPQLRDAAHVLWMPPGYMWVAGLAFKLLGFSLETARWLSAVCVAAGGAALAAVFRRARHPFGALLLLAVLLLSPIAVLVGNVARMEALLFALASTALLLLQRGWVWGGLALAALLPLVHPIGAFFAVGAGALALLAAWREPARRRPRAVEWLALALACAAWAAYAVYVAQHLEQFRADMEFQFGQKADRTGGPLPALARLANPALAIPCLGVGVAAVAAALGRRVPSTLLLAYATPLAVVALALRGWPYDFYPALLWLFAAILASELACDAIDRAPGLARIRRAAPLALALALAATGHLAYRRVSLFRFNVERAQVPASATAGVPFVTPEDRRVLAERVRELRGTAERPVRILFLPMAEALLFAELDGEGRRLVFPILRRELADVVIVHESRHFPFEMRQDLRLWTQAWQGITVPSERWPVVRERDGTERWRVYDRTIREGAERPPPS
jgi:hypothetical protein